MAPRRLVPRSKVDQWEADLRVAVGKALDDMRGHVHTKLRSHGLDAPEALTAASRRTKAAVAAGAALGLTVWGLTQWQRAINQHVRPVAQQVAADAVQTAQDAVPGDATWGMPTNQTADAIAATLVGVAAAAGVYLGQRLNDAVSASSDPGQAAVDTLSTADDILGTNMGAAAEGAANVATAEVGSYLAAAQGDLYTDATKTWNAVGDENTRPDHMDADGQEVPLNATFQVGGEDMVGPGDPSASDEQTMNCRCWLTTDGIDPGIAVYGEPEEGDDTGGELPLLDASQGLENIINRAGRMGDDSGTGKPVSYPN